LLQGEYSEQLNDEAEALLMIKESEEVACILIETKLKEEQLKEIIERLIEPITPELFIDAEGRLGLIVPNSLYNIDELELLGCKIYEECPQEVPIIVAVGHSAGGVACIQSAYEKALSALGWKRYHNREGIIDFNDLSQNYDPRELNKQVNKEALSNLMEAICSDEPKHIEVAVDALLAAPLSRIPSSDEEYVRIQLLALEMDLLRKLKELGGNVDQFVQYIQQSLGKLTEINSYSQFHQYAMTLSLNGFEALHKQRKQSENNTLFHVVQYVNQQFREKIQLQELAQKFHMNPNYLGQVFKQETGKSFREYLNDKRIEEAKRLLRQGRQSISEVAANSGYPNTDYFVSQFKRMTGIAPSAYRKQEKSEYIDG
jgi:two-component system response regulator YesN